MSPGALQQESVLPLSCPCSHWAEMHLCYCRSTWETERTYLGTGSRSVAILTSENACGKVKGQPSDSGNCTMPLILDSLYETMQNNSHYYELMLSQLLKSGKAPPWLNCYLNEHVKHGRWSRECLQKKRVSYILRKPRRYFVLLGDNHHCWGNSATPQDSLSDSCYSWRTGHTVRVSGLCFCSVLHQS